MSVRRTGDTDNVLPRRGSATICIAIAWQNDFLTLAVACNSHAGCISDLLVTATSKCDHIDGLTVPIARCLAGPTILRVKWVTLQNAVKQGLQDGNRASYYNRVSFGTIIPKECKVNNPGLYFIGLSVWNNLHGPNNKVRRVVYNQLR